MIYPRTTKYKIITKAALVSTVSTILNIILYLSYFATNLHTFLFRLIN